MSAKRDDADPDWEALTPEVQAAITAAWRMGMPATASALYGRWWQFETWLRSLVYVELKAAFGPAWANHLPSTSEKRKDKDHRIQHMPTADAQSRLAYADVSDLLSIVDNHWALFEPSLFEKEIWTGRVAELRHIRNRIGHCRRPHADDLARVEQMLRDLETGAFRALAAFNRQTELEEDRNDPLVNAWVQGNHRTAERLMEHAARQYKTDFRLLWSRRPWSTAPQSKAAISGTQGYVWHAEWYFRDDRRLDLRKFWNDWNDSTLEPQRERMLLACVSSPSSLQVSFPALEDANAVADSIGRCFDLVLMRLHRVSDTDYSTWVKSYDDLDPRVQVGGPWSIVDDSTTPITLFCAQ